MLAVPFFTCWTDMGMRVPAVSPTAAFLGSGGVTVGCLGGSGVGLSATLAGLVTTFSGIGMSLGFGGGSVLGVGGLGAMLGLSEASTSFGLTGTRGGSGIDDTILAEMEPVCEVWSPQD